VKNATYVIGAVMLGTFAVTWVVGRLVERLHDVLTAISAVVVRACLAALFALFAARAAMRGGYAWIEASILGLFALWSIGVTAAMIWVWVSEGLSDGAETSSG